MCFATAVAFAPTAGAVPLDSSFGPGGAVTASFSGPAAGETVAVQPDGKIVVAGEAYGGSTDYDVAVLRYTAAGALDPSFGSGGRVTTDVAGGADQIEAVALQPDGKIVVVGYSWRAGAASDVALVRYQPDGSLDASFGSGGKVTTDFAGGGDGAYAVAIRPDGRIVVAGFATVPGTGSDVALVRYLPNGALDGGFGSGGKVTTDVGTSDFGYDLAVQADGKLVVVGEAFRGTVSGYDLAVLRYTAGGAPDAGFGTGGRATVDLGRNGSGEAVAVQGDGRIVTAGSAAFAGTGYDMVVVRFDASGQLDPTFGAGGQVSTDFAGGTELAHDIVLQGGGIVVAGETDGPGGNDFALVRFAPDGAPDAAFGETTTDLAGGWDAGRALALQGDGRLLVAGETSSSFAVARYGSAPPPAPPLDTTPPLITASVAPQADANGWHRTDVTVSFSCQDPGSGIASCSAPVTLSADGRGQSVTGTAVDRAGNTAQATASGIDIDETRPAVTCDPAPTFALGAGRAIVSARVTDALSGPVASVVSATVATDTAGEYSVELRGDDRAGNSRAVRCGYRVYFGFQGFLGHVDNPPAVNVATAGQTVVLVWRLTRAGGTPIDDPASFGSIVSTDCAAATRDAPEAVAGNSGLKSLGNGYWQLNWKTPKRYAGECRLLRLTLGDDSIHTARFRFR
jgi:uncharacterized delta-60 repeat protein